MITPFKIKGAAAASFSFGDSHVCNTTFQYFAIVESTTDRPNIWDRLSPSEFNQRCDWDSRATCRFSLSGNHRMSRAINSAMLRATPTNFNYQSQRFASVGWTKSNLHDGSKHCSILSVRPYHQEMIVNIQTRCYITTSGRNIAILRCPRVKHQKTWCCFRQSPMYFKPRGWRSSQSIYISEDR